MCILQESYDFLQQKLLPRITKRQQKLFTFGFEALTLKPFISLNSNARTTVAKRKTAETKIYRVMHTTDFVSVFPAFIKELSLIQPLDTINVDFSTFCGYHVLTFAKQTALGRALPVYFGVIEYPITSVGSQTIFIKETIQAFISLLGFVPHLVFDRGFESPYLVPFLVEQKIPFTMRFKKDKHVLYCQKDIPLRNLPWFASDTTVEVYEGVTLWVIRSEKVSERKNGDGKEEPWYVITNEYQSSPEQIIARYYFRFEIEETFKDLKHIFDLKKFYRIKTQQTFTILLWFYVLSVWLSFLLEKTKTYLKERVTQKRRKKLSVVRYFSEAIQLELFTAWKRQFY
jgi:Transposase DDE domain